jgi:aspartokinase/homoserine dehydrogenase 1
MQVLKFGGSSVANASNINKVIDIVKEKIKTDKTIVVVSAFGGITDILLQCSQLAADGDEGYKQKLQEAELRHLSTVKELITITQQSAVLSLVKTLCNEIEDICTGIFLLKELSERTRDRIVSYGEILSSKIIAAKLNTDAIACEWVNSANLIITNSNYGSAAVDFSITDKKITGYFAASSAELFLMPGFIASDSTEHIPRLDAEVLIIPQPLSQRHYLPRCWKFGPMYQA